MNYNVRRKDPQTPLQMGCTQSAEKRNGSLAARLNKNKSLQQSGIEFKVMERGVCAELADGWCVGVYNDYCEEMVIFPMIWLNGKVGMQLNRFGYGKLPKSVNEARLLIEVVRLSAEVSFHLRRHESSEHMVLSPVTPTPPRKLRILIQSSSHSVPAKYVPP
ncbi:Hypothetical protein POVN_LOCUS686 [uncultured virus]|nr:Hypothetical protein POVN_LOCUS686 [uncultured virus]